MTFSPEQLNFFKFSKVVLDEFPVVLRLVFVFMWDTLVASPPGVPNWDDSVTCLNMFIAKEGGEKKVPNLNKSFKEWDCTALFRATLFAQTFAVPDGTGGVSTLDKLCVRPRGLSAKAFHPSVISPTGNQAETYALALDQLRLLRNTLCHQNNTQNIDKATFDNFIMLAKDAFTALGQDSTRIDEIGMMGEDEFPTAKQQQLEDELKKEKDAAIKFKQIDDHLTKIESQVKDVGSDVKDVKTEVTYVKTQVKDVGSDLKDVKTEITDVKTQVTDVGSDVKELKADVADIKQAMEVGSSNGLQFLGSCIPDKIPHFVGRQKERQAILNHLTDADTRLVDVWGPPGFGKTAVAINVAHHLREMKIPVYFASLRGMESKDELVSKLLSIFTDAKQVLHISPAHWLIRSLQELQDPFVLILDNADDLLESGDTKRKEQVLMFINEILAQCNHIKFLLTTRESLDYLSHKLPIHLERVGVLDEVAAGKLVRFLLRDLSNDECSSIVQVCGQVPLAIRLLCSTIREENISLKEFLEELKISPLIDVLDNESYADDARLKIIINKSFERLPDHEKNAFVSLAVFPGWFRIEESTIVLDLKTELQMKKIIRSLERKSLIDCSEDFDLFTVHSLLRSFINEKGMADPETRDVLLLAQHRFHKYHISTFAMANEHFLTGHSNAALRTFFSRRENMIVSLLNGPKDGQLYREVVEVLSKAELFLFAVLSDEELLFKTLFDTAVEEARKRQNVGDERKLLAAKSFGHWAWFSSDCQTWDHSLQAGNSDAAHWPAKLLCYFGIHQILCGKLEEGISSLKSSVDRLSSCYDEAVLRVLVFNALADSHSRKRDHEMASYFRSLCSTEAETILACVGGFAALRDSASLPLEDDSFFFLFTTILLMFDEKCKWLGSYPELVQCTTVVPKFTCLFGSRLESLLKENFKQMYGLFSRFKDKMKAVVDESIFTPLFSDLPIEEQVPSFIQQIEKMSPAIEEFCVLLEKNNTKTISGTAAAVFYKQQFKALEDSFASIRLEATPRELTGYIAKMFDLFGVLKRLTGDYSGALEEHHQAIRLREETFGHHVDTATTLTRIGCLYFKMNNESEAMKSFQGALELRKQLSIHDHKDTADIYFTLAENHFTLGNYEKAIEAHMQALDLRTRHLGEHPITGKSLHHIAVVYCRVGETDISNCHNLSESSSQLESYKEALTFCQQALTMRLEELGEHVDTAESFHVLGVIHFKMHDLPLAVEAFHIASNMRSNLLGDHEYTALSYYCLGQAQRAMGDLQKALESFQNALQVRKNCFIDHPAIADSLNDIGIVHYQLGDYQSAREQFLDAVERYKMKLEKHESTATGCHNLAATYLAMGRYSEALEFCQQALSMRRELLGEHVDTANSFHVLGEVQYKLRDFPSAVDAFQKASDIRSNLLGEHKHAKLSYLFLALAKYETGVFSEFEVLELLPKAWQLYTELLVQVHPGIAEMGEYQQCLDAVAGLAQCEEGDTHKALEFLQNLLKFSRNNLKVNHVSIADAINMMGRAYLEMGDYHSAREQFHDAVNLYKKLLDKHEALANSCHNLAVTYLALESYSEALEFCWQALNMRLDLLGEHVDTANSFQILGEVYYKMCDFPPAVKALQKASDMRSKLLGDHEDTALSFFWLGIAQSDVGDLNKALESLEKAIHLKKKCSIGDHLDTADSTHAKGVVYLKMDDYHAAREQFQDAVNLYRKLLSKHASTASCFHNLAVTHLALESYPEALEFCRQTLTMRLELLGEHVDTARSLHVLGEVQYKLRDFPSAVEAFQKASDMRSNLLGDSKDTALSYHQLGKAQSGMGDLNGALESLNIALKMRKDVLGDHPDTAKSLNLRDHVSDALNSTATGWKCSII